MNQRTLRFHGVPALATIPKILALALVVGTWRAPAAWATSLPESYPLGEASDGPTAIDPNLAAWLLQHEMQTSPFDMDKAKFNDFVSKQDQVTALYLRLARGSGPALDVEEEGSAQSVLASLVGPPQPVKDLKGKPSTQDETPRQLVDAAFRLLSNDQDASQPTALNHPLLPFLYLEMLKTGTLSAAEKAQVQARFSQVAAGTCASKQSLLEEINRDNLASQSDEGLRDLLARVNVYRSRGFKRSALRRMLSGLPEARQKVLGDQLLSMAQPYPELIHSVPWLSQLAERTGKTGESREPEASFGKARQMAGHKLCGKARDTMLAALHGVRSQPSSLNDAVNTGKAIDGCFRAHDTKQRADFWRGITKAMSDAYGFDGWAESVLRLGFIDWSRNAFTDAKTAFQEVISKAEGKVKKYEARSLYALARIAENENDIDRASALYQDYMIRFPEQENFEEAMMATVLLRADKGDWSGATQPLEALIQAQTLLPPDDRSTSALSFALFWAGRGYLEQGRPAEAGEMWRRVASEYYSTYYGALGHYMLEKMLHQHLALQPSRTPTFRMHMLREAFSLPDQQKVRRIEALMHLGMRNEAICELEEMDLVDGKPEKLLVKALVMYSSGRWLDAVKAYDALPRTFRNTLPVGFEKILFPQRFGDEVAAWSHKAGVDPAFVMAIIRQESVFNPLARSPVGAMGLMQLMPQTAALELHRIEPGYMPENERREIKQHLSNPLSLLVAETNLRIGVHHVHSLLEQYLSPVYVLSAYNASPAAAHRWMTTLPTKDALSFIERIPYKETRAYVKLVLRNYFYYTRWYGGAKEDLHHLDTVTSPLVAMARGEGGPAAIKLPAKAPMVGPPASAAMAK